MDLLKISYQIAGVYDFLLGIGLLMLRTYLAQLLNMKPVTNEPIADALSLFLIGYGILLILESLGTNPNLNVGYVTIFIRLSFFLLILFNILFYQVEMFYIFLSLTDLLTGLFIAYAIYSSKREVRN